MNMEVTETQAQPVLYLFVFMDVPDMNPGKAMAQCCHAGNDLESRIAQRRRDWKGNDQDPMLAAFEDWKAQALTFGTTIVLETTENDWAEWDYAIYDRYNYAAGDIDLLWGDVRDPTYPMRNYYGDVHLIDRSTLGWMFMPKGKGGLDEPTRAYVDSLRLHR